MDTQNTSQRPRPTINIVPSAEKFNDTIERRLYISITYADNKGNRIVVHGEEENAAMQRKMLQGYRLETPKKKQRLEEFREGRRMKGSYQGNTLQAFIEELAEVLDMVAEAINSGQTPDSCFRLENRTSIKRPKITYTDPSGYRVVFSANVMYAGTSNESMRWKVTTTYDESFPLDYPIEE